MWVAERLAPDDSEDKNAEVDPFEEAVKRLFGPPADPDSVDPDSPGDGVGDTIYFGTLAQVRSTDAGASFAPVNNLHSDTHTWGFAKQSGSPTLVYCGNDDS